MDPSRIDFLISGCMSETLSEEEWAELAALAQASPELQEALVRCRVVDRLVREAAKPAVDPAQVLRMIGSGGGEDLKHRIVEKIREESGGTTRPRTGFRRPTRRYLAARRIHTLWFAIAAAGLLFGIILVVSRPPSSPASSGSKSRGSEGQESKRTPPVEDSASAAAARARAEQERKDAESRLQALREEEARAEQARREARDELRNKADEAFLEIARKRKEQEERLKTLRDAEEEAKRALPKTTTPPTPLDKPETLAALAKVERVAGEVYVLTASGRVAAKEGDVLLPGQGVETVGPTSGATVVYPDKTRLELGAGTEVRELKEERGKRVTATKGKVRAVVSRQPKDQPMVFATPNGEATVLGTTLRLGIDPDPQKGTRLEVEEGKVRLKNLAGRFADVTSGHIAVAAVGIELQARPFLDGTRPTAIELESFGTGRGVKPSDGPVKRLYLEPLGEASGGRCVGAPCVGTEISGELQLASGAWYLWVRFRDDTQAQLTFEVRLNGLLLDTVTTDGKSERWHWKRFPFESEGQTWLALRSTYEAQPAGRPLPTNPYGVINRWDLLILTRDAVYTPERK